MQETLNNSFKMRVTQVLEKSRLSSSNIPVSISFKSKTVWYAFLYWILQSFIIACVYGNTAWFLPLFNLVTVGWAWDKITSRDSSIANSIINISQSDIGESNNSSNIRTQNYTVPDILKASHNPLKNSETSSSNFNIFGALQENDIEDIERGSMIGSRTNPIIDSNNDQELEFSKIAENIRDNL